MRTLLAFALVFAACSADPVPLQTCSPGVQTACACPGGAQGAQRCNDTGSAFGVCDCPDGAAPDVVTTADVAVADAAPDVARLDAAPEAAVDVVAVADTPMVDTGCNCGPHATCVRSSCRCDEGFSACVDHCADLQTDPANCGACSRRCRSDQTCVAGVCACPAGQANCGSACTPTNTVMNCGGCGIVCASGMCSGTACCRTGETTCGGACVNLDTAPDHCGACDNFCPTLPHVIVVCRAGRCSDLGCETGWQNCNTSVTDGCEAHLTNDSRNCGACGNACPGGRPCVSGHCTM